MDALRKKKKKNPEDFVSIQPVKNNTFFLKDKSNKLKCLIMDMPFL